MSQKCRNPLYLRKSKQISYRKFLNSAIIITYKFSKYNGNRLHISVQYLDKLKECFNINLRANYEEYNIGLYQKLSA